MTTRTSTRTGSDDYYVPYREFDRAVESLQNDISEIKTDVKTLLSTQAEGKGAAGLRRIMLTAMVGIISAGWWVPDLIHKSH